MTLEEWTRIAEAAITQGKSPGDETTKALLAYPDFVSSCHPARVIAALKVIEAAKGLRSYAEGTGAALDFDDALAELEALE